MTIEKILIILFAVLTTGLLVALLVVLKTRHSPNFDFDKKIESQSQLFSSISQMQTTNIKAYNDSVIAIINQNLSMQSARLADIQTRIDSLLKNNEQRLEKASDILEKGLDKLQKDNEKKLEEMRLTVDEKLNVSLERRLGESFKMISERLEAVYKGLGEMQSLSIGVGDLKRVLTNVKTRGVYGEISLETLLEQMLTKDQFEKNVCVKKNSQERVDFAVKLPGKDGEKLWLPIDCKFPLEDYLRLCKASEIGNASDVEIAEKQLEKRVKEEAKSISEKYINIPQTTDFAIMFVATESLFSEIVKRQGLVELLQTKHKVIVCGPTTISALLSSLQIGFRTLAIEKRSSEIWKLLGEFKKDFETFSALLEKTQRKLFEATDSIDSATKRTQIIAKKLRGVQIECAQIETENSLLSEIVKNESGEEDN